MKRYWMLAAMVGLSVVLATSWVIAQDEGENPRRRPPADRPARADRPGRPGPEMRRRPGGPGGMGLPRIPNLTDEQKKKIAEIRRAGQVKIRKIQEQIHQDILKLLTPEQAKVVQDARRRITHRGPGGVILTDEQKKILDDARAQAAKADSPEARGKIMGEALKKVRASYTDEQKKQAREARQRFRDRRDGPPRDDDRRRPPPRRRPEPDNADE